MEVSIIIPTYNTPEYLKDCINSIRNQKVNFKYEILLGVDNCKETLKKIKSDETFYKGIRLFYLKNNVGPFIIRNTLTNVAKSENILFFDSDDIMSENMLNNFYQEIDKVDFVKFNYLNFSKKIENILHGSKLMDDSVIGIKKSVIDKMIGFQPWVCGADSEFLERLLFNGFNFKRIDGVSFYRRIHEKNLTIKKDTNFKSEIRKQYIKIIEQNKSKKDWPNPESRITEEYTKIKFK